MEAELKFAATHPLGSVVFIDAAPWDIGRGQGGRLSLELKIFFIRLGEDLKNAVLLSIL